MPGDKKESQETEGNIAQKEGAHVGVNKGTQSSSAGSSESGSEGDARKFSTTNREGESKLNELVNDGRYRRNVHSGYYSSGSGYDTDSSENEERRRRLEQHYERIRREEQEQTRKADRERRDDMKKSKHRSKGNSKVQNMKEGHQGVTYDYVQRKTQSDDSEAEYRTDKSKSESDSESDHERNEKSGKGKENEKAGYSSYRRTFGKDILSNVGEGYKPFSSSYHRLYENRSGKEGDGSKGGGSGDSGTSYSIYNRSGKNGENGENGGTNFPYKQYHNYSSSTGTDTDTDSASDREGGASGDSGTSYSIYNRSGKNGENGENGGTNFPYKQYHNYSSSTGTGTDTDTDSASDREGGASGDIGTSYSIYNRSGKNGENGENGGTNFPYKQYHNYSSSTGTGTDSDSDSASDREGGASGDSRASYSIYKRLGKNGEKGESGSGSDQYSDDVKGGASGDSGTSYSIYNRSGKNGENGENGGNHFPYKRYYDYSSSTGTDTDGASDREGDGAKGGASGDSGASYSIYKRLGKNGENGGNGGNHFPYKRYYDYSSSTGTGTDTDSASDREGDGAKVGEKSYKTIHRIGEDGTSGNGGSGKGNYKSTYSMYVGPHRDQQNESDGNGNHGEGNDTKGDEANYATIHRLGGGGEKGESGSGNSPSKGLYENSSSTDSDSESDEKIDNNSSGTEGRKKVYKTYAERNKRGNYNRLSSNKGNEGQHETGKESISQEKTDNNKSETVERGSDESQSSSINNTSSGEQSTGRSGLKIEEEKSEIDKNEMNSDSSESSGSDPMNRYYEDSGQDFASKEKKYNSRGGITYREGDSEGREKVNYHFSSYMLFERKEFLSSNEIELGKMIGSSFSKEIEEYCRVNVSSLKTGTFLEVSFEYSRKLEELRSELLDDLIKNKKNGKVNIHNILHIVQNSTNTQSESSDKEQHENENPLRENYNNILKQYLCYIFMNNPGKNELERLYNHNLALGGLVKPIRTNYKNLASSSVSFQFELYTIAAGNIYLLAHMLLLSIAYLSFDDFFVTGAKSFYSLETLLLAKSDFSFFMFNEMCDVHYKPKKIFKKDITFIPIESRPKRYITLTGERKIACDLLELVLNAIMLINIYEIDYVFDNNNIIGYENSLSFSISAIRIFSKVCPRVNSQNMLICEFEESSLYNKNIKKTDIKEHQNQKNLKKAFDLLKIFAEIENNSPKAEPNPSYIKLIMEQNLYTEFYKYLFWYDSRKLINVSNSEKKSKKMGKNIYNDFIKMGEKLKKKIVKAESNYKMKNKALIVYYEIIDRYATFLNKKGEARRLFLNDTSFIRHYLYFNRANLGRSKTYLENFKKVLEQLEQTTDTSLRLIVRGNYVEHLNSIARNEILFYVSLFILSAFSVKDPVVFYYNEKKKMKVASLSEKFASSTSALIPHKLRRIVVKMKKGILKKKLLTTLAKIKLLQHIPAYLLENVTSSIRFTTHTIATMQIIQNAKLISKEKLSQMGQKGYLAKQIFTKGGFPNYADNLISKWYSEGFEEYKRKQIERQKMEHSVDKELKEASNDINSNPAENENESENEKKKKEIEEKEEKEREKKENKLFFSESDKWDLYLNKELARALGLWLDINADSSNSTSFVYKLVEDSKFLLENNIEENIIFSRTVKPTKQTAFRKFFNKLLSLGNMLLRKPSFKVEHALWFGATLDIKKVFILLEKVSELHKLMRDKDGAWLINEAFIEIVDHIVDISTFKHLREPFSVSRNPGMMAINPKYAVLPHEQRLKEFQNSMCADHCSSVWKIISSLTLQHMKNPDSLKTYEEKFSKNAFGNEINDKDFVHSFKMVLGGDAALHYFDNLLSKSMKKELKAMKYGASLTSAFSLKLTKVVFTQMNLPYLSQMFYVQAPYFGHFIGKWQKERQKSRMKEILAFMTLGSLSIYTMLSAMDITQHAEDIGMGPIESCYTSVYPPPQQICLKSAVKATLTSSTEAAMKSVFSVGLFASIGPYIFAPMVGLAVWNILKSEFKVLQRIDMALKNVFKNMWNKFLSLKGITKLRNIFKRKDIMKKKIIENAENKMKEMKENPEKAKAHKMSVESMHKYTKGNYHYVSYARIQI